MLGPLELRREGELVPVGGAKPRALLADLLLHAHEVVSVDQLVDDLWGEQAPASAPHMVEVYVSKLRKLLEPDATARRHELLLTRAPGYVLRVASERLDLLRFEAFFADGRAALAADSPARAAAALRSALSLWRGPALADFAFEAFAQAEIARLEELRLACLEERIEADLALGGQELELVCELEALTSNQPLRERLHGLHMLALYRTGRQADALAVYRDARATLVEELGIEPGIELHGLEQAILRQDPALNVRSGAERLGLSPPRPRSVAALMTRRKTITVLSIELAPATIGGKALDPETLHGVFERYLALVSDIVSRHGGTVEGVGGDAVLAVFGSPLAREDDALRAVRAAVETKEALARANEEQGSESGIQMSVQIGIDTAEAVVGFRQSGETVVTSEAVKHAARLAQLALPGEAVLGEATRRLVGDAARVEQNPTPAVAGHRALAAWRLVSVAAPAFSRHLDAPLIGRETELAELRAAFAESVRERRSVVVQLLGEAGIGKSRLALELVAGLGSQATVLSGRCLSYGEGITFWPLVEALKQALPERTPEAICALLKGTEHAEAIAERIACVLGVTDAAHPREELFWAVRSLFESLARRRPLLLFFDDVHWAESGFLDLLDYVAKSRTGSIVLLCVARTEFSQEQSAFAAATSSARTFTLEALSGEEAEALIETLGGLGLGAEARRRIVKAAEGNPLFLEQMVAFARAGDADGESPPVPPTIEALLAARLDRLGPGERAVLERAAVVGREFSKDAVVALLPDEAQAKAPVLLKALIRKEFVRHDRPSRPLEETYRFRHILIQDAAYRSVPKRLRAELHERLACQIEQRSTGAIGDDEVVGYHLEHAYRLRAELGPVDEKARELAVRAGRYLGSAGRRALRRGDMSAAVSLLTRATSLLPPSDDGRVELLPDLGRALSGAGELARAEAVLTDAIAAAEAAGTPRVKWWAILLRSNLHRFLKNSARGTDDAALRTVEAAISAFRELRDERGLARAWRMLASLFADRGDERARQAFERAHEHARRAGDEEEERELRMAIGHWMLWGPTPASEAIRYWEEIRENARGERAIEAGCFDHLGVLYAMQGRFEDGRRLASRGRDMKLELGLKPKAASSSAFLCGYVEMCAGDPAAAERELRFGYDLLEEVGEKGMRSTMAASLARAIYLQGRHDEAEQFVQISIEIASSSNRPTQMLWQGVRAKILAARGELENAERLARAAVKIASETELPNQQGDVLMDLAEVLVLAGKQREACAYIDEALQRFGQKGNLAMAGRAASALARLKSKSS